MVGGQIFTYGDPAARPAVPSGLSETNTISVKFVGIGKPETITAPAHYGT